MSNVEDGNVNALDAGTVEFSADTVRLAIYEGVLADFGDPDETPEVRDKRTRSQKQHANRKARKAADQVLSDLEVSNGKDAGEAE